MRMLAAWRYRCVPPTKGCRRHSLLAMLACGAVRIASVRVYTAGRWGAAVFMIHNEALIVAPDRNCTYELRFTAAEIGHPDVRKTLPDLRCGQAIRFHRIAQQRLAQPGAIAVRRSAPASRLGERGACLPMAPGDQVGT
ncbi:hypothetical protein SPHV1_2210007 [Novosphingobium sp. KN65.2]|nr:hypothetical protein SPHV1_2210007 [Novosphingobium sp. KN65.2]